MGLLRRDRTAGEFVLRFARHRKIGDKRQINRILKSDDLRFIANALIHERLEDDGATAGEEEGFFARLISWLADPENQAKIEAIIKWLQELFAGFDV